MLHKYFIPLWGLNSGMSGTWQKGLLASCDDMRWPRRLWNSCTEINTLKEKYVCRIVTTTLAVPANVWWMAQAPRSMSFSQAFHGGSLAGGRSEACWDEGHFKQKCLIYCVKHESNWTPVTMTMLKKTLRSCGLWYKPLITDIGGRKLTAPQADVRPLHLPYSRNTFCFLGYASRTQTHALQRWPILCEVTKLQYK